MATRNYNSLKISQKLLIQIFSHVVLVDMGYSTPCWLYAQQDGRITPHRYVSIGIQGKVYKWHRALYVLFVDAVPLDLECDHLCNIPACGNPSHIEITTHRRNTLRSSNPLALNAKKTHCPQGHEYSTDNLVDSAPNVRACKTCARIRGNARSRRQGRQPRRDNSTECKYGHLYTPENLIITPKGSNACRMCANEAKKQYKLRKRCGNISPTTD